MGKTYDAVAFKGANPGEATKEIMALLKEFDAAELKAHQGRFGTDCRYKITVLAGNHPLGGWPFDVAKSSPVCAHQVMIRAYRQAPETLPNDFEWEKVEGFTEAQDVYGGTFKDATKRT
jgi:hypothetical protein